MPKVEQNAGISGGFAECSDPGHVSSTATMVTSAAVSATPYMIMTSLPHPPASRHDGAIIRLAKRTDVSTQHVSISWGQDQCWRQRAPSRGPAGPGASSKKDGIAIMPSFLRSFGPSLAKVSRTTFHCRYGQETRSPLYERYVWLAGSYERKRRAQSAMASVPYEASAAPYAGAYEPYPYEPYP
jgi:hypothetical protein